MDRLTAQSIDRKRQVRQAALSTALGLWEALLGDIGDSAADEFIDQWSPRHAAALAGVSRIVDAYLDSFVAAHGETPSGVQIDHERLAGSVRGGTPLDEVYERPFIEARRLLSNGSAPESAMAGAKSRLANIVATDVQQAYRVSMRERLDAEPTIPGYQRVPRGGETCVLCLTASTQRYRTSRLMPIHPGCDCAVRPLAPGTDVNGAGTITDRLPTLEAARQAAAAGGVSTYDRAGASNIAVDADRIVDLVERDHGELGPILGVREHRHTTVRWRRRSRREFDQSGRLLRGAAVDDDQLADQIPA